MHSRTCMFSIFIEAWMCQFFVFVRFHLVFVLKKLPLIRQLTETELVLIVSIFLYFLILSYVQPLWGCSF